MRAAVIARFGGPEGVAVEEVPAPQPGAGEVLVQVQAAALNHLDLWVLKGGRAEVALPHILGCEAAGTVASVGPGVQSLSAGEEVLLHPGLSCGVCPFCRRGEHSECVEFGIIGMSRAGTFAELVAVPAGNVYPRPAHLSPSEAAALALAHLTAWRMLVVRARLQPGETVLIHGIGGGVALAGLQIAKLIGAEVLVTSSSDEKLSRARELGADHTLNYAGADVAAATREVTGGMGVDVVFETVGAATWPASIAGVRKGGRVVICGITTGAEGLTDLRALYWNQISLLGSTLGSADDFRQMLRAVSATRLRPVVDSVYPLGGVREAMARMESGQQFGKIVLDLTA